MSLHTFLLCFYHKLGELSKHALCCRLSLFGCEFAGYLHKSKESFTEIYANIFSISSELTRLHQSGVAWGCARQREYWRMWFDFHYFWQHAKWHLATLPCLFADAHITFSDKKSFIDVRITHLEWCLHIAKRRSRSLLMKFRRQSFSIFMKTESVIAFHRRASSPIRRPPQEIALNATRVHSFAHF